MITFWFAGEATPQGRPRATALRGKDGKIILANGRPIIKAYDPMASRSYKQFIRMAAQREMEKRGAVLLDEPVIISVKVFRLVPKSFSKKKLEDVRKGMIRPSTKPDLDNYVKSVIDGMTQVVWKDDSQVVGYEGTGKYYTLERPGVYVCVWTIRELMEKRNQKEEC
ncbi:MAG: RusA family crossover junction endodeoxyribonuclease [Sphaerochaetaceae bacterium]